MGRLARQITSGFIWLSGGTLLASLIGFLGGVIIARLLGPSNYGVLSVSQYFPLVIFGALELGLTSAITRYMAMNREEGYVAIILRVMSGLASSIIVFIFSQYFAELLKRPYIASYIKILSIYILGLSLSDALKSALLARGQYSIVSLSDILRHLLRVSISILLIILGFGVYGAIWGFSISSIVVALILFWPFTKRVMNNYTKDIIHRLRFLATNKEYLAEVLSYSLPLYIPNILSAPLYKIVEIYVARYISNREMGGYNVAINLSNILLILNGALVTVIFSTLSTIAEKKEELNRSIRKTTLYTALIMIPISLALAGAARSVIYLIYGSSYMFSSIYLSLISFRWIYASIGSLTLPTYLRIIGNTKPIMVSGFIHAFAHVALSIILIRNYGLAGMLIAYIVADGFSALYILLIALKQYKLSLNLKKLAVITILSLQLFVLIYFFDSLLATKPLYPLSSILTALLILVAFYIVSVRHMLSYDEFLELEEALLSATPSRARPFIRKTLEAIAGR